MNNLGIGTVVRSLSTGHEGIILDSEIGPADVQFYTIEWRHGITTMISANDIEPADNPIHAQLEAWHKEGRRLGYGYLFVGQDGNGNLHRFFGKTSKNYGNIVRENGHLTFRFWELRRY